MLAEVDVLAGVDDVALAALEARVSGALWGVARNEEATSHVERALALAETHDLPEVRVNAHSTQGLLHLQATRSAAGQHEFAAAVELAREAGIHLATSPRGRLNIGDILFQSDRPGGDEQTQRAVELAHRVGSGFNVSFGLSNLALIRYFGGDWEAAEVAAHQALDTAPDDYQRDTLRLPLMLLHVARGRAAEAQAELDRPRHSRRHRRPSGPGALVVARTAMRAAERGR